MPIIEQDGTTINLDEDGFLVNAEDWNERVAGILAAREGVGALTDDKVDILKFLREHHRKYAMFPIVRHVCKNVHQPNNCMTVSFMNPVKAWKIAGLPNPGREVIMFESWEPLGF
jgi:TusE/DsrC/DsvC family sulfur relay protein